MRKYWILCVLSCCLAWSNDAQAQVKIGVVDTPKIFEKLIKIKQVAHKAEFEQLRAAATAQAATLKAELQAMKHAYQTAKASLAPAARREVLAGISAKAAENKKILADLRAQLQDVNLEQSEIDNVNRVIILYAEANNYTMIFSASAGMGDMGILYSKAGIDLTAAIWQLLNQE